MNIPLNELIAPNLRNWTCWSRLTQTAAKIDAQTEGDADLDGCNRFLITADELSATATDAAAAILAATANFRSDLQDHCVLIVCFFAMVMIVGTTLNLLEIYFIVKNGIHSKNTTIMFLVNLAAADIIKCNVTIPFSTMALLFHNWILGEFLCYFLPMLQDIPVLVTVFTLLIMTLDRFLFVRNPNKQRFHAIIFSALTWLVAVCIVLPYPIFSTYVDLKNFGNISQVYGTGICIFGIEKNFKEYSVVNFFCAFVFPLLVTAVLLALIFQTLRQKGRFISSHDVNDIRINEVFHRNHTSDRGGTNKTELNRQVFTMNNQESTSTVTTCSRLRIQSSGTSTSTSNNSIPQHYLETTSVGKEKHFLLHIFFIALAFTLCSGPLNSLSKVIFLDIHETYDITPDIDKLFVICTIIGFLPTIITPVLVFSLLINKKEKWTLQKYFLPYNSNKSEENLEFEENFRNTAFASGSNTATILMDADNNWTHHIQELEE